ncbi:PREDICTED: ral guanine nucleotide dissociation stimulator-like [Hipposideros armiger]|uniref:Ral guanine nucleotide dissociation stimulator-like n=1 Tax=Hipposideros armiger TaxID=186990 RepID=A0A8B7QXZ0_HIPAR|nr:PREDICTED: ral guanine nucleotide dissociation stimulator-like [Hipposideros armiger]
MTRSASPARTQSSTQETGQELTDGVLGSIPPKDRQVPPTTKRLAQAWGENASGTSKHKPCMMWTARAHRLDRLVEQLVPAFLGGDPTFVPTFLGSYRTFATTQQVLDTLFTRYGCCLPHSEEDGGPLDQMKMALSSILAIWLNWYPEDFF